MRGTPPKFHDYETGPDFDRARSQIATPFLSITLALDTAQTTPLVLPISGDFIYFDANASQGNVTLEVNNQYADQEAPFYCQPGFALHAEFKQIKLTWTAQVGKVCRILYSTGQQVIPAFAAQISLSGNSPVIAGTAPSATAGLSVSPYGYTYGTSWKSNNALAGGGVDTVFLPAANINGAIVWRAESFTYGSGAMAGSFLAKTAAPATIVDGDLIALAQGQNYGGTAFAANAKLEAPVRIPAGKGLYYFNGVTAENSNASLKSVLVTFL